jgi:hypothetical protein
MDRMLADFKTKSFVVEQHKSTMAYEVKRTRAVWDDALSIPGTNRRGGWRCPPGTRYGGQITDRFGRNCGWGVSRRLANEISDLGERLENIGDRRQRRREQRAVRRQGRGAGVVERAAGRVARALETEETITPDAPQRPRRQRQGAARRRSPNLRESEERRMQREIDQPGAERTEPGRRRRATVDVVDRPRPDAPTARPAKKAPAKKAAAKKKAPAKKAPAKKRVAKKQPAKKAATPKAKPEPKLSPARQSKPEPVERLNMVDFLPIGLDADNNLAGAADAVRKLAVDNDGMADVARQYRQQLNQLKENLDGKPDNALLVLRNGKEFELGEFRNNLNAVIDAWSDVEKRANKNRRVNLDDVLRDDTFVERINRDVLGQRLEILNDRNNFPNRNDSNFERKKEQVKRDAERNILALNARYERIQQAQDRGDLSPRDIVRGANREITVGELKDEIIEVRDAWQEVLDGLDSPSKTKKPPIRDIEQIPDDGFYEPDDFDKLIEVPGVQIGNIIQNEIQRLKDFGFSERDIEDFKRQYAGRGNAGIQNDIQYNNQRIDMLFQRAKYEHKNMLELRKQLSQNPGDRALQQRYELAINGFAKANFSLRLTSKRNQILKDLITPSGQPSANEIVDKKALADARKRVDAAISKNKKVLAGYLDARYGAGNSPWKQMTPEKLKDLNEKAKNGDIQAKTELEQWARDAFTHNEIMGANGKKYAIQFGAISYRNGNISLSGTIYHIDENGARTAVGATRRVVRMSDPDPNNWEQYNEYMEIKRAAHKGAGIQVIYNQHAFMYMNAAGIKQAKVGSAWDGPYVWGRVGFRTRISEGQAGNMKKQLKAFREGRPSVITNSDEANRIAGLLSQLDEWYNIPIARRPEMQPVRHMDFIYALDIPETPKTEKKKRQKQLRDWFVDPNAGMPMGSGEYIFAENGVSNDPRD